MRVVADHDDLDQKQALELYLYESRIDLLRMFPSMFTLTCFMMFLVPTWIVARLGRDPDVQYWIGSWCLLSLVLPFLFMGAYFVHARLRVPHKPTILVCLLTPCLVLLALGDSTHTVVTSRADQLRSTDCDTFVGKRQLERSWQAANLLYVMCLNQTISSNPQKNFTVDQLRGLYRVQDCEEYPAALGTHFKDWNYLQYLENEHGCAGWCTWGMPLWTHRDPIDSCSIAASQVFSGKVRRASKQVVIYSVLALVFSSCILIMAGPAATAHGFKW